MKQMRKLTMHLLMMTLSISLTNCGSVPPPKIPVMTGKCTEDVKRLMRYYILPDSKLKHRR